MECDGKIRECVYYLRRIHVRATFWHGTTLSDARQNYRQSRKGDYTIDLGERYEEDPGTCICPEGCEKWIEGSSWGKAVQTVHIKVRVVPDENVPHIILYKKHLTVTEITSTVECVDPKKEVSHTLKEGEDLEEAFALLRKEAEKKFSLEDEMVKK